MLTRRHLLAVLAASALPLKASLAQEALIPASTGAPAEFGEALAFSWDGLVALAKARQAEIYLPRPDPAPELLGKIGYEQHHAIKQPVANGLFAEPGRDGIVTMFHLGELFRRPVRVNVVEDGNAREVLYRRDLFAYPEGNAAGEMPNDAGFAGFRVHEPWTGQGQPGDWLAFLGASYLRSSGDLKQYGISARGIALETGAFDGNDEEFPDFTEFWVEEMQGGRMRIYALLDGPSISGAFRFEVTHFPKTVMDVTCHLFLRRAVKRLGVAPLTSMYWYSQETRWAQGDWRPEVHDSDGLLIHDAKGGAIWRPLTNPAELSFSSFLTRKPRGFGLMQRDRAYASYEDQAAFERRPNLWVEPKTGFEEGSIQLVEFPTAAEYGDNIVAFFVPAALVEAGDALAFDYRLHWSGEEPEQRLARMVALRLGRPRRHKPQASESRPERIERKVILDFSGEGLPGADMRVDDVSVTLSHGEAHAVLMHPSADDPNGWRVSFDAFLEDTRQCEVTVDLRSGNTVLAETVVFRFDPEGGLPSQPGGERADIEGTAPG